MTIGGLLPGASLKITGWRILCAFRDALLPNRCASCSAWIPTVESTWMFSKGPEPGVAVCRRAAEQDRSASSVEALWRDTGHLSLAAILCGECRQRVVRVESPLCSVCGRMFRSRQGADHRCGDCCREPKHFASARAAALYIPGFREVVHQYKYRGRIQLAGPLGEMLLAALLRFWGSGDMDLILPVPLHSKRFKQRGFNQAYWLMRRWKYFAIGLAPTSRLLLKTHPTAPQTGLGKAERRRNIRNAFTLGQPVAVRSRRILLVDDVYTTGATVNECARVLMQCGAKRVDVLTLARAV